MIRTFITDDHKIIRLGLATLFASEEGFTCVGEAESGTEAIKKVKAAKPDVVIMDLLMPGTDGATATAEILKTNPNTHIVLLTSASSSNAINEALDAGAIGAVLKSDDDQELLTAVRQAAAGIRYLSPQIKALLENDPPIPKLTPRQKEVLESLTRGLTNADIARQLGLCETRVVQHVNALFTKIGAANRTEAVSIALRKQLLKI